MEWKVYEEKFLEKEKNTLQWFESELKKLRSNRVSPSILNDLKINIYDSFMSINELANVSSPEPNVLIIKPYDMSTTKQISASIVLNNVSSNPQVDADRIRLSFPPMTEDIRKSVCKQAKNLAEEAKVKIRKIRQEIQDSFKKEPNNSDDDKKYFNNELDKVTKKINTKIIDILSNKEKEIMSI